jgi:hypothetical protein
MVDRSIEIAEAERLARRAIELERFNTALAHLGAGRYDDAVIWMERALRDQPNYPSAMRIA